MGMNYLELAVQILPGADGRFDVRVASDEGEGNSQMALPFTLNDLVGVVYGVTPSPQPVAAPPQTAIDLGSKLFEALFQGEGRDVLSSTESRAQSCDDTGVRIRLTMDLAAPRVCEAAALPWELMCRSDGMPLATSPKTVLVRAVDTPMPTTPRPLSGALRVMVIQSNPLGTAQLDLQAEIDAIKASWAKLPGIEVEYVKPTGSEIQGALAAQDYHVIHYLGHGGFDPESIGAVLFLENDDGTRRQVDAKMFAAWLKGSPLRLVFLNACHSGQTLDHAQVPPFAGIATALIREGVPAVVGNQFAVSDTGAIAFAKTFYERIVQGCAVDTAAALARLAIYDDIKMPVEWAIPVLYMRSRDGDLFPRASDSVVTPQPAATAQPATPPTPEPVRPMSDSSNRSISIGGAVSGSVVQTGDHNVTTLTTTTLPPPESVDMNAVMQQLRAIMEQMQLDPTQHLIAKGALDTAEQLVKQPQPNKAAIGNFLTSAVDVLSKANDAATQTVGMLSKANDATDQISKLKDAVVKAASWLGDHKGTILNLVGLVAAVV
jgi:hypothetical protein